MPKKTTEDENQEKLRKQLVNTTRKRGLLNREFMENQNKSSIPPINTTTQTDLLFKALMGDRFHEYNTIEEKIDAFDLIYQKLSVVINDRQRQQFAEMLKEESHRPDQLVTYHGTKNYLGFYGDVITEFRKQLELEYAEDIYFMRAFDDLFTDYKDVTHFMKSNDFDRTTAYGAYAIAVNPFLFGSGDQSHEATFYYFLQNDSQMPPDSKKLLKDFFKRVKIEADLDIFQNIYEEYIKNTGGVCYQFFIDADCVDQVVRPATLNGRPNPLKTDQGELNEFSAVLAELRKNPDKYADYIKTMQARLYLKPDILHKSIIKRYRANPLSLEKEKKYKSELQKAVSKTIGKLLLARKKLPPTAFSRAKGKPRLQRQMEMIYQNNNLPNAAKQDVRILIHELLEQNNVGALVQLIIAADDLDLNIQVYDNEQVRFSSPILLELFKGTTAYDVYNALQPYKDQWHIAKIIQQLQGRVFLHCVSIGNLNKVKELFAAELNKDNQYMSKGEIDMAEMYPNFNTEHLLKNALDIAVEHDQVEVIEWVFDKCRENKHQPILQEYLTVAIKKGYRKMVELILLTIENKELTALKFDEFLYIAQQHNHIEIIAALLEKINNMPADIANIILIQENSILIYLIERGHKDIVEKSGISLDKLKTYPKFLIPKLLNQSDVEGLVKIIVTTADLDLSKPLITRDSSNAVEIKTLLDLFAKHIAISENVFVALQSYKERPHISKVLIQLQYQAWYHYVAIGDFDKVKALFESGHPDKNERLYNALKLAADNNQVAVFTWILEKYQEVNLQDGNIFPSRYIREAVKQGYSKIVELYLSYIDKKRYAAEELRQLLYLINVYDKYEIMELVFEKLNTMPREISNNVFIRYDENSILFELVKKGNDMLLDKILKNNNWLVGSLNFISSEYKLKLLFVAIENDRTNVVDVLLRYSADANKLICDSIGYTHPLLLAVRKNHIPIVKLLLAKITNFDESDQYGKTAVMVAAELGYSDMLKVLLSNPRLFTNNKQSFDYFSKKTSLDKFDALSLAAKRGHIETIRILLADITINQFWDIKTALQQAVKFGHEEAVGVITKFEAASFETTCQCIKSASDFGDAMLISNDERRERIYTALKDKLSEMITDYLSIYHVFSYLTPEQAAEIAIQTVKTISDFRFMMSISKQKCRTKIYEACKGKLPEMIKDADDFSSAFEYLTLEQCAELGRQRIKTKEDFYNAIQHIEGEKCVEATMAYKQQAIKSTSNESTVSVNKVRFWAVKYTLENESQVLEKYNNQIAELNELLTPEFSEGDEKHQNLYRIGQFIKVAIREFASTMNQAVLLKNLDTITNELMKSEYQLTPMDRSKFVKIIDQTATITHEIVSSQGPTQPIPRRLLK